MSWKINRTFEEDVERPSTSPQTLWWHGPTNMWILSEFAATEFHTLHETAACLVKTPFPDATWNGGMEWGPAEIVEVRSTQSSHDPIS